MARTNKKQQPDNSINVPKIYSTAIYTRLSRENEEEDTKETMQNQINFVSDFANKQLDMIVHKIYSDNGYTGTNFDRPAFEEMIQDVLELKVDCIIVKDFSRFGRNFVECGFFIENTFTALNIRFISINDNYDNITATANDNTMLAIKNVFNTMYVNDISKKVKTALKTKQSNGEFLGRFTPYGYLRSKEHKNKLVVNQEVADNVKAMFEWRSDGVSYIDIAQRLNKNKQLPPTLYNATVGDWEVDVSKVSSKQWTNTSVIEILKNEVYIGNLVYNKTTSRRGKPKKYNPPEEWIIVENSHEPIIDKDLFYKVQEVNDKLKPKPKTRKNRKIKASLFADYIYCFDCKNKIGKHHSKVKGYYFLCRFEKINRGHIDCCSYKKIFENELHNVVLESIRHHLDLAFSYQEKIDLLSKDTSIVDFKKETKKRQTRIKNQLDKSNKKKICLYELYANNELSLEQYSTKKVLCELEEIKLNELNELIETEKIQKLEFLETKNKWIKSLFLSKNKIKLTPRMIEILIDKIYIKSETEIEILWKFQDDFNELKEKFD